MLRSNDFVDVQRAPVLHTLGNCAHTANQENTVIQFRVEQIPWIGANLHLVCNGLVRRHTRPCRRVPSCEHDLGSRA
jgi:hypothetical protein